MSSDDTIALKTGLWRQFCIDVLSNQSNTLKPLALDDDSADLFIQFLRKHGLESLLIDLLEHQNSSSLLPDPIIEKLTEIRRTSHIKELYRKQHLEELLQTLNYNNIKSLILKGTAFAYSFYPHPYQRFRLDTDILIKLEDKTKIDQLLVNSGFSKSMNISGDFISHQNTYRQTENGINHAYDIHWRITNRNAYANRFDFDQLYQERNSLTCFANTAFRLNNTDMFLHATVHYFGHRSDERDRLAWIYDLHLLCNELSNQDWELLIAASKEKKLNPLCEQILKICKNTFSTQIPIGVFEQLAGSQSQLSEVEYKRVNSSHWSRMDQFKSDWIALTFVQRCQLVKEYLFPPAEFILKQQNSTNRLLLPYFYMKRIITGSVKVLINKNSD